MTKENEELLDIKQVTEYAHIGRQAVYVAMKKGRIKGIKIKNEWKISREEIDRYRMNKYNRDERVVNGVSLFDAEKGTFSINQVAKCVSEEVGIPYSMQRVYYLIRSGQLKASRYGYTFVIFADDLKDLIEREKVVQNMQYRQISSA